MNFGKKDIVKRGLSREKDKKEDGPLHGKTPSISRRSTTISNTAKDSQKKSTVSGAENIQKKDERANNLPRPPFRLYLSSNSSTDRTPSIHSTLSTTSQRSQSTSTTTSSTTSQCSQPNSTLRPPSKLYLSSNSSKETPSVHSIFSATSQCSQPTSTVKSTSSATSQRSQPNSTLKLNSMQQPDKTTTTKKNFTPRSRNATIRPDTAPAITKTRSNALRNSTNTSKPDIQTSNRQASSVVAGKPKGHESRVKFSSPSSIPRRLATVASRSVSMPPDSSKTIRPGTVPTVTNNRNNTLLNSPNTSKPSSQTSNRQALIVIPGTSRVKESRVKLSETMTSPSSIPKRLATVANRSVSMPPNSLKKNRPDTTLAVTTNKSNTLPNSTNTSKTRASQASSSAICKPRENDSYVKSEATRTQHLPMVASRSVKRSSDLLATTKPTSKPPVINNRSNSLSNSPPAIRQRRSSSTSDHRATNVVASIRVVNNSHVKLSETKVMPSSESSSSCRKLAMIDSKAVTNNRSTDSPPASKPKPSDLTKRSKTLPVSSTNTNTGKPSIHHVKLSETKVMPSSESSSSCLKLAMIDSKAVTNNRSTDSPPATKSKPSDLTKRSKTLPVSSTNTNIGKPTIHHGQKSTTSKHQASKVVGGTSEVNNSGVKLSKTADMSFAKRSVQSRLTLTTKTSKSPFIPQPIRKLLPTSKASGKTRLTSIRELQPNDVILVSNMKDASTSNCSLVAEAEESKAKDSKCFGVLSTRSKSRRASDESVSSSNSWASSHAFLSSGSSNFGSAVSILSTCFLHTEDHQDSLKNLDPSTHQQQTAFDVEETSDDELLMMNLEQIASDVKETPNTIPEQIASNVKETPDTIPEQMASDIKETPGTIPEQIASDVEETPDALPEQTASESYLKETPDTFPEQLEICAVDIDDIIITKGACTYSHILEGDNPQSSTSEDDENYVEWMPFSTYPEYPEINCQNVYNLGCHWMPTGCSFDDEFDMYDEYLDFDSPRGYQPDKLIIEEITDSQASVWLGLAEDIPDDKVPPQEPIAEPTEQTPPTETVNDVSSDFQKKVIQSPLQSNTDVSSTQEGQQLFELKSMLFKIKAEKPLMEEKIASNNCVDICTDNRNSTALDEQSQLAPTLSAISIGNNLLEKCSLVLSAIPESCDMLLDKFQSRLNKLTEQLADPSWAHLTLQSAEVKNVLASFSSEGLSDNDERSAHKEAIMMSISHIYQGMTALVEKNQCLWQKESETDKKLAELLETHAYLFDAIDKYESIVTNMNQDLAKEKRKRMEAEEMEAIVTELESQLNEQARRTKSLEATFFERNCELTKFIKEDKNLKRRFLSKELDNVFKIKELEKSLQESSKAASDFEEEQKSLIEKLEELELHQDKINKDTQTRITYLQDKIKRYESSDMKLKKRITELRERQLRREKDAKGTIQELKARLEKTETQLAEEKSFSQLLQTDLNAKREMLEEVTNVSKQAEQLQANLDKKAKKLAELENARLQTEQETGPNPASLDNKPESDPKCETNEPSLSLELETTKFLLKETQLKYAEIISERDTAKKVINEINCNAEQKNNEIAHLEYENKNLREELSQSMANSEKEHKERKRLQRLVFNMREEKEAQSVLIDTSQLQEQKQHLEAYVQELTDHLEVMEASLVSRDQEAQKKDKVIHEQANALRTRDKLLEVLRRRIDSSPSSSAMYGPDTDSIWDMRSIGTTDQSSVMSQDMHLDRKKTQNHSNMRSITSNEHSFFQKRISDLEERLRNAQRDLRTHI